MGSTVTVQGLCVTAGTATLVDNLNFTIQPGEVLALIGESGSGKTTTALALMGHARRGCRIAEGVIRIGDVDVRQLAPSQLRSLRGRTVSYIAQSAAASFNPSRTILDQVVEPALLHRTLPRAQAELKAIALFRELALPDPETIGQRYPHQVSGGQLQRLMAAMALITDPELVILDEPTTALDVVVQQEIMAQIKELQRELGFSVLFITHDMSLMVELSHRMAVMYGGRIVETAKAQDVYANPRHPYTQALMGAFPPLTGPRVPLTGLPDGVKFRNIPDVTEVAPGHLVAPFGADVEAAVLEGAAR
jgi:peptide/nickel transport system ATP-binding protein